MEPKATLKTLLHASREAEQSGEIAAAIRQAQAALTTAQQAGDAAGQALAAASLAYAHIRLGHYGLAHSILQQALAASPPDSVERAEVLLHLGFCAAETDDIAAAEEHFRQAIDLGRQLGEPRVVARGLHSLASGVYTPIGEFPLSISSEEEAYRLMQEHALTDLQWLPLANLTWTCSLTGQRERTLHWLADLHRIARPGSLAAGYELLIQAELERQDGNLGAARGRLDEASALAESRGLVELTFLVREGLAKLCRAAGDAPAALAWAGDALTIAGRTGYRHAQGRALIEHGRAAWALADAAQASADFRAALELLRPLHAGFEIARTTMLLAHLLAVSHDSAAASAWIEAATAVLNGGYTFWLVQESAWLAPLLAAYLDGPHPEARAAAARLQAALDGLAPPPLHIYSLGGFRVLRSGLPIPEAAWQRRKARQLLLYLIIRRRSVSRDELLEALWPDLSPASAALALNTTYSDLRRILEPHLGRGAPSHYMERGAETLAWRATDGFWCDTWALEQKVREGVAGAGEAIRLYQGDFLPEEPYVDWVLRERERLRSLYLNTLMAWLDDRLRAEAWQEVLDLARRIVALEPWLEEAWRALMLSLAKLGRRSESLRAYQDCARAIRAELDAEPAPETRALRDQVRAQ